MKIENRKSPEKNTFFSGLLWAVPIGVGWWVIILAAVIEINK